MCLRLLDGAPKRLQAGATLFRLSRRVSTEPNNDKRAILRRLSRRFRHGRHLVDPVALPVLSDSLLRAVVAKLLSLPRRVLCRAAFCLPPLSRERRPAGWGRVYGLPYPLAAQRCPPNHANRRSLPHGSRRLCDLWPLHRHLHRSPRAHLFSGRTPHRSAMAISNGDGARFGRRDRGGLFPGRLAGGCHAVARLRDRFRRELLLGALQRARETAVRHAGPDPQFRDNQFHHVAAPPAAHDCVWKNRDAVASRRRREPHPYRFRRHLYQSRPRFVLRRDSEGRSRPISNFATHLSRRRPWTFRALFW